MAGNAIAFNRCKPQREVRRSLTFILGIAMVASFAFELGSSARAQNPAPSRHAAAQAAGQQALHLCSGYFATESSRELVRATLRFYSPSAPDAGDVHVDEQARTVSINYGADMPARKAVARPGRGCVLLPTGATHTAPWLEDDHQLIHPDLDGSRWPMGDSDAFKALPRKTNLRLDAVVNQALKNQTSAYGGDTWGLVVVQGGKIVAERYQHGFSRHVAARTNSMCKGLGVSLIGVGLRKGLVDLKRKAILAEWRRAGDPRGHITVGDLLHMSSGLYSDGPQDPLLEIYRSGAAIADMAALTTVDSRPGSRFVYAGTDTNLAMRALREAMADDGQYADFPYRDLLWKIGMTRTVIETDWNNDFIVSGQCWSTARDFARLGLLYLANGQSNGEQILPKGWAQYVAAPAPTQPIKPSVGGDAGYGAQFWLYGGIDGLPPGTFAAFGGMGQYAVIVPAADLVIVRRGFDQTSQFNVTKFAADVVNALRDN